MKKTIIIKNNLFSFALGVILTSTISVFALTIIAKNVTYNNNKTDLNTANLQDAINELYSRAIDNGHGNKTCKKLGELNIGTKLICDPGDGESRFFYVLKINDETVDLIMDRNIILDSVDYETAKNFLTTGDGKDIPTAWNKVLNVDLPSAQDIANAVGNTDWDVNTAGESNWYYFDKKDGRFGTTRITSSTVPSEYGWLFEHTRECKYYGCPVNTGLSESGSLGYWTKDLVYNDSTRAWRVSKNSNIGSRPITDTVGIRLVITVEKTKIY